MTPWSDTLTRADAEWMGLCVDCDALALDGEETCAEHARPVAACDRCGDTHAPLAEVWMERPTATSPGAIAHLCPACAPCPKEAS